MSEEKLWQCTRCWGEQFETARPRCRHCKRIMVEKDNPDDEAPVLERLADV